MYCLLACLGHRYARLAATVADYKRKAADGSKFEKELAALNVAKSFQVGDLERGEGRA